jgi:ketosteroid isomerase-like protein
MTRTSAASIALALWCATAGPLRAQPPADDVTRAVLERDRAFWAAYNRCDVPAMSEYFTDDVEFYHDRGGITLGRAALVKALQDGLCGDPAARTRREAVDGAVKLYPMKKGDTVYGAILAGEHLFYVTLKGKPESLDGRARFADLWTVKDGVWRMSRVLSFDHGPAVR